MAIDFYYDREKAAIFTTLTGPIDVNEVREYFKSVVDSTDFPPDSPSLVDFTAADFASASKNMGNQLVQLRASFPQRSKARVAFVVGSELGFGMSRMYQLMAEEISGDTRVFRDRDEAQTWLLGDPQPDTT